MSDGYGRSATSPISADQGVRLIVWTCLEEGVTDRRQIAYVLATAQHESLGFSRLEEDYGRKQAVTLGYHGGEDYFGRGYVHLTHDINYRSLGRAVGLGERLVDEPSLASDPRTAAQVLVVGMRDGLFVPGHGLARYVDGEQADYPGARRIVNGRDRAEDIARLAVDWEARVDDLVDSVRRDGVDLTPTPDHRDHTVLRRGDANAQVFALQQYLSALGMTDRSGRALSPDGDFGPATEQAVIRYKDEAGVDSAAGTVDQALFDQIRRRTLAAVPGFRLQTMDELHGPLNDGVLGTGDRGDAVADLQRQLRGLGATGGDGRLLDVSRRYDRDTRKAVAHFQRQVGLAPADGLADERTRDAINVRAVELGLPEAAEAMRRRERAHERADGEQPRHPAGPGNADGAMDLHSAHGASGPFADPILNRYYAAVRNGDAALANRVAFEFGRAPEGSLPAQGAGHMAEPDRTPSDPGAQVAQSLQR